jgi:hypothetical protein
MPSGKNLFTNRTITTGTSAAPSAVLPVDRVDFISVGVQVVAVSGTTPQATFGVQWSFDGDVWTNPTDSPTEDVIGTFTDVGYKIKRMPIKAPYWRLAAQVTGTNSSFTVTGNALIWND